MGGVPEGTRGRATGNGRNMYRAELLSRVGLRYRDVINKSALGLESERIGRPCLTPP